VFGGHLHEGLRRLRQIYNRRPGACNGQCVSWPTFEGTVAHGCDCKVDETRKTGMSNMRTFPAVVVFWQNGRGGL